MIAGRRKKGSKAAQPVEEEEEEEEEADTLTPLNSTGRQPSVRDIGERGKGGRRGRGAVKKKKQKKSKSGVRDVARLVMSLGCHGYDEQLVWLEAYLHDEARDRSVDGECVCVCER